MKILLTGTTGYIGQRLLPALLADGHQVACCTRDKQRFDASKYEQKNLSIVEIDFLKEDTLDSVPEDIDVAFYLIHSMSSSKGDFESLEEKSAKNFVKAMEKTHVMQVIYLGGIVNDKQLSKHLRSRKLVEDTLGKGKFALTTLRAGIILGSGSASFEIIRDLVEKLPVMVAPKWLNTKSQPIAIRNVIQFLKGVVGLEKTYNQHFDIGGPEILTYKEMLLRFAQVRNLKRKIITVPVMTPKLSSYWLYFVTSVSYSLAVNLVSSMSVEVVVEENDLAKWLDIKLLTYEEAIRVAFDKIQNEEVVSSWIDAQARNVLAGGISQLSQVPTYGCFVDKREKEVRSVEDTLMKIWTIGGDTGWYTSDWLWRFRGFLDKLFGGVGLRRGRKHKSAIFAGDSLDFWRVLYANREEKRLLLYAEMKLPGEAWLEFEIKDNKIVQTATFRPLGVAGRAYWYSVLPFHGIIFRRMINELAK
ncbi:SDR family oxidoreductase [Litoribacter ruber]|uniref:SDR family oxidoreductase n=1 Tax=Litoribacter ruber TaxID=702568 RepID=UPI001BD91F33|nr:SDR family oxidoreductase [Litoribacter ruber]MBT0812498.1 SDR family oxidoreductase [Litoribacter ruber]